MNKHNRSIEQSIAYNLNENSRLAELDFKLPVTFLIHGFTDDGSKSVYLKAMKDAIFKSDDDNDVNVVIVDWTIGANPFMSSYTVGLQNTFIAAEALTRLITELKQKFNVNYNNITIVGFSLGAHIAGLASKHLSDGKVGKVIGLDPAGLLYSLEDHKSRITSDSAQYVECIHTGFFVGTRDAICQVDFFINGGKEQPRCKTALGLDNVECSHVAAVRIYAETKINPRSLKGRKCSNIDQVYANNCKLPHYAFVNGRENAVKKLRGIYYVKTN